MPYTIKKNPNSNTYKVIVTKTKQIVAYATTKPNEVIKAIEASKHNKKKPKTKK
jgi:DNA polymerase IIIc chi subunit